MSSTEPPATQSYDPPVSQALADFMSQGLLAPHIRRMRTEYARRRTALLEAMGRFVTRATPLPAPGGLHMIARLPDTVARQTLPAQGHSS